MDFMFAVGKFSHLFVHNKCFPFFNSILYVEIIKWRRLFGVVTKSMWKFAVFCLSLFTYKQVKCVPKISVEYSVWNETLLIRQQSYMGTGKDIKIYPRPIELMTSSSYFLNNDPSLVYPPWILDRAHVWQ